MLRGQMMNVPLTITSIMNFAEQVYADSEIVSVTVDDADHRYTYSDCFKRVRQLANALSQAGIKPGDRIATMAWNDYRHLELYYAISCSGAVCHTINPRLFPEQIEYIINHAEDKLLFIDPAFVPLMEKLQQKLPKEIRYIVLTDGEHMPESRLSNVDNYENFIARQPARFDWPALDENSASALCYTSGTTGNPKGVLYSHRSTVLHSYGAALPDAMSLSANDVILPIVPMFHVNAWSIPYSGVMVGAKLVFPGGKMGDGETLQRLIEQERVSMSAGVPTVWLAVLNYLRDTGKRVDSLKRIVVGGAACPLSIMEEFSERHDVYTHQAWGMTETGPLGVVNTLKPGMAALPKNELDSIKLKQGRPIYGVDLRIVDDEGHIQPWDGESTGEVRAVGNWICDGYFGIEDPQSHDENGFFRTGDVASMDAKGFMRITDRTKDVIKSGGEWISSIELENVAMGHPAVAEAAVIGVPHKKWSERPLLIIVKATGATVEKGDILAYLDGKVAKWWVPDDAVFVDEIPHTATGKISKKELRLQFADYSSTE